ncbi:MAG: hypothetical protein ABF899_01565 [Oenococcus sp.]|uniref:hypothetical protein n=1 Tax=Oenococcus sp. TaxID=1979414 RepID=UPI0039EB6FBE
MTQKNLFVNVKEDGVSAVAYGNISDGHIPINGYKHNLLIPFPEKIKMSEKNFNRLQKDLKTIAWNYLISHPKEYGLTRKEVLILALEHELGNDQHKFVEIEEQKHAYTIKKELEGSLGAWDKVCPYLYINDDDMVFSDNIANKYSRSEFKQLPKAIQALFDEGEDDTSESPADWVREHENK